LGSDVEGVYDGKPRGKGVKVIERIDDDNFEEVIGKIGGSKSVDVTEGMRGKIMKIKEHPSQAEYVVFDLREKGLLKGLMAGEKKAGTTIKLISTLAAKDYSTGAVA
jgi:isopentenyl phosphate kinase